MDMPIDSQAMMNNDKDYINKIIQTIQAIHKNKRKAKMEKQR